MAKVLEISVFLKLDNNRSTCVTFCRSAQIWTQIHLQSFLESYICCQNRIKVVPKFPYLESQLAFSAEEQVKTNLQADLIIKEFGLKCKFKPQAKMTAQMQPELAADFRTLFVDLPYAGCFLCLVHSRVWSITALIPLQNQWDLVKLSWNNTARNRMLLSFDIACY